MQQKTSRNHLRRKNKDDVSVTLKCEIFWKKEGPARLQNGFDREHSSVGYTSQSTIGATEIMHPVIFS